MRANLAFLIPLILFIFLIDWYVYKGLKASKWRTPWPPVNKLLKILYWIIPISLSGLYIWFFGTVKDASGNDRYVNFSRVTMSFILFYFPKFFYIILLLIDDLRRLFFWIAQKFYAKKESTERNKYPKISRSKFLSQMGIIFATLPFVSILFGVLKGRFNFSVRRESIKYPNLPKAFSGLRIIQISDLHLGSYNRNYDRLNEAIDLINEQKPDLVFFTGDLVNNFKEETIGWEQVFKRIKSKVGNYSVLGNHDYGDYSRWPSEKERRENFQGIVDAHERLGFRLLRNESEVLSYEDQKIAITGVENWGKPPFPQYGDLKKATNDIQDVDFKILLSHDPSHWELEVLPQTNFALTLAGHTHGMQFGIEVAGIKWSPAQYRYKRWAGLYQEGNQYLYVNRGLGYIGMPARIGMNPEITVIDIHRT